MKIYYSTNPLCPGAQAEAFDAPDGSTPNVAIKMMGWDFKNPTVLLVDGEAWGRAQWDTELPQSSHAVFVELPGGAAAVLGVISILLAVYAYYYASNLDLDSTDVGTPDLLSSFSTGANRLRLGQPFTEHFGRFRAFPDLIQQPYVQNVGNDQYLYFLGVLGVGEYSVEEVYIGNTPLTDYADSEYNIVGVGEAISLVPNLVWTCNEATGQELTVDDITYVVTPPLTEISSIEYDITFPGGLIRYNSDGDRKSWSVIVEAEVRLVDNAGAPLSDWASLETRTFLASSKDPLRYSHDIAVPLGAGRYEFRIHRTTAASESSRVSDRAVLSGLRGYGAEHPDYGDVTLVEAKIKAQDQLSANAASQINVVATRKLYEVGAGGFGAVLTATRSIVDAVAYMVTSDNGGQQSAALLNFSELYAIRSALATAGYYFDFRFGGRLSVMDACSKAAAVGLCAPCMPGGEFALVMHENQATPSCIYTHDNIRDLRVTIAPRTPDNPTCVEVRYVDPNTWNEESVFCYDGNGSEDTPLDITLEGCTDRQQAYEVGMFAYLQERLERTAVKFTTDLSGYIPALLSKILVPNKATAWGSTGLIAAVDGENIWLSEPVDFEGQADGQLYITKADGTVLGPYTVTPTESAHCVIGTTALLKTLEDDGLKAMRWLFGLATDEPMMVRVSAINPQGRDSIQISGTMIDDAVYGAPGDVPAIGEVEVALLAGVSLERLEEDSSGANNLRLTWSGSAVSVRIELDEGDSDGYVILEDEYVPHTYEFDSVSDNVAVKVTPYDENGIQLDQYVIRTITNLPAPTGLTIDVDSTGITADWDDYTDADEYLVALYVNDVEIETLTVDESTVAITTAQIAALGGPWAEFDVYVWAMVDGEQSAPAMETKVLTALAAPTGLIYEDRIESGLMLSWDEVAGAVSYVVCYSDTLDSEGEFVPSAENVVYEGELPQAHITELVMGGSVQHGFKVAAQQYGHDIDQLNFSDSLYGETFPTTSDAIVMIEDGWVGIGATKERIVFDGSGNQIEIYGDSALSASFVDGQFNFIIAYGPTLRTYNITDYLDNGLIVSAYSWETTVLQSAVFDIDYANTEGKSFTIKKSAVGEYFKVTTAEGGNPARTDIYTLLDMNAMGIEGVDDITLNATGDYVGLGAALTRHVYETAALKEYVGAALIGTWSAAGLTIPSGKALAVPSIANGGSPIAISENIGVTGTICASSKITAGSATAGSGILNAIAAGADAILYADCYSDNIGNTCNWYSRKSHSDTQGVIAETLSNEFFGGFYFLGVDNVPSRQFGAKLYVMQTAASGAGWCPTKMVFETSSNSALNTNAMILQSTGQLKLTFGLQGDTGMVTPGARFVIGGAMTAYQGFGYYNDYFYMWPGGTSRVFCIQDTAAVWDNYSPGNQANPTLVIHSATRAATATDQWISFAHDQTDAVITSGKGFIKLADQALFTDKVCFTQTDGNEFIDSLADGYMDYGATTGHRFNRSVTIADTGILSMQEYIDFTGTTGVNAIKMPDNLADAFSIQEATNKYLTFCTTDGAEKITFGKPAVLAGLQSGSAVDKSISGGTVTVSAGDTYVVVRGESPPDPDEVATISGGTTGQVLIIRSGAEAITYKHATGNIYIVGGADFAPVSSTVGGMMAFYNGTYWICTILGIAGI